MLTTDGLLSFENACIDLLLRMQETVIIRYAETIYVERKVQGPEGVDYQIDLVTAQRGDGPKDYLWLTYRGFQFVLDGARGVFDGMKFSRAARGRIERNLCPDIVRDWQEWSPQLLRPWQFVGITTLNRAEKQVEVKLLRPSDFWVQRQLAIILGMLFQGGRLAFEIGVADQLGQFMRTATKRASQFGIRL